MSIKTKNKINILHINQDERLSRFVVDLPNYLQQKQEQTLRKEFILIKYYKKFVKLLVIKAERVKLNFNFFKNQQFFKKCKQLTVFNLLNLLYKILCLLYKILYSIGRVGLFSANFLFLLIKLLIKYIFSATSKFLFFFQLIKNFLIIFIKQKIRHKYLLINHIINWNSFVNQNLFTKTKKRFNFFQKSNFVSSLKSILFFSLVLFFIIFIFKIFVYFHAFDLKSLQQKIAGASEVGVENLLIGSQLSMQTNFNQAGVNFAKAGENFIKAQEQLEEINDIFFKLAKFIPNNKIRLAGDSRHIIAAGLASASLGQNLGAAFNGLLSKNKSPEIFNQILDALKNAEKDAKNLNLQLKKINNFPDKNNFKFLQEKAEKLEETLVKFNDIINKLQIFLGKNQNKRYLLIFQNNTEMRATGGFIGSYALIDFSNNKIKNIEVPGGGSYDTEGGLIELIVSPEPLHLVNPLWHFWDANWWPDWPISARKLMWFYERSDGPTVDGVISFTPTVMEKLLKIIGPIDMTENYGVVINAENFWITVQSIVEKPNINKANKSDKNVEKFNEEERNKPKKIIGALLEKILDELPDKLDKNNFIQFLSALEDSLNEKHILFYFNDKSLQQEIEQQGWDGKIKQTNKDYLAVINTNIGGGKSDKSIKQIINHSAEIMQDGSVINIVKIERTHTGSKNELFSGVRNVNWMRIYVPEGSQLLEAQGFQMPDDIYFEEPNSDWKKDPDVYRIETMAKVHQPSNTKIYIENNKTVFANWTMTDPGKSAIIYLKYRLPFNVINKEQIIKNFFKKLTFLFNSFPKKQLFIYSILIQKQSGSLADEINSSLKIPDNFKIIWQYPKNLNILPDGWQISDKLNVDKYYGVVLEQLTINNK